MSPKENAEGKLITAEVVAARFAATKEMFAQIISNHTATPTEKKRVKPIATEPHTHDLSHRTWIGSMSAG